MVLAAREEESASDAVAEGWVFAGSVSGEVWGWEMGVCNSESEIRLTEGIGHAEGVAVCFDKVAAFDVGLEVEVGD